MSGNLKDDTCSCAQEKDDVIAMSYRLLPENLRQFIEQCLKQEHPHSYLIAVLHKAQEHFGYLSPQIMDAVAYLMQIPAAKVSGVASFYHYFRFKPCGKFAISVCLGTACYVNGSEAVLRKFCEELGIKEGETTKDGIFTLEVARCLGACALAPVVKIGEEIYSRMTPDRVPLVIKQYLGKK